MHSSRDHSGSYLQDRGLGMSRETFCFVSVCAMSAAHPRTPTFPPWPDRVDGLTYQAFWCTAAMSCKCLAGEGRDRSNPIRPVGWTSLGSTSAQNRMTASSADYIDPDASAKTSCWPPLSRPIKDGHDLRARGMTGSEPPRDSLAYGENRTIVSTAKFLSVMRSTKSA
jgi:hypothetical protein